LDEDLGRIAGWHLKVLPAASRAFGGTPNAAVGTTAAPHKST
jgi:hypothetical protein